MTTKRALIMVDVQNDFCPGGSLAVPDGDSVVTIFNNLRKNVKWDLIVLSQDWHPSGHLSFASSHSGKKVFEMIKLKGIDQCLWPDHCVQGSEGAKFHEKLVVEKTDIIVQKGKNKEVDSYSAFFDNNKIDQTELNEILKKNNITDVYCGGLAYDFCVKFTAVDSSNLKYKTFLIDDATRGISKDGVEKAKVECKKAGVEIVQSKDIK